MSAEEHEVLRKLPLSKLGADLACAVIDHDRGEDAVKVVCALINLASVMSGKLSPVDQMICAVVMHQAAIETHEAAIESLRKPQKNGKRIEVLVE
jgi:hypothetical protein